MLLATCLFFHRFTGLLEFFNQPAGGFQVIFFPECSTELIVQDQYIIPFDAVDLQPERQRGIPE